MGEPFDSILRKYFPKHDFGKLSRYSYSISFIAIKDSSKEGVTAFTFDTVYQPSISLLSIMDGLEKLSKTTLDDPIEVNLLLKTQKRNSNRDDLELLVVSPNENPIHLAKVLSSIYTCVTIYQKEILKLINR